MDVHFQQTRHWNRHVSDNLYEYHHMIFADDDSDLSEPLVQALFDGDGFPYYESPFKGFICERFRMHKVGYVFPMVISSEFWIGQYRVDAPHFNHLHSL